MLACLFPLWLGAGLGALLNRWWLVLSLLLLPAAALAGYLQVDLDAANASSTGSIGVAVWLLVLIGASALAAGAAMGLTARRLKERRRIGS